MSSVRSHQVLFSIFLQIFVAATRLDDIGDVAFSISSPNYPISLPEQATVVLSEHYDMLKQEAGELPYRERRGAAAKPLPPDFFNHSAQTISIDWKSQNQRA